MNDNLSVEKSTNWRNTISDMVKTIVEGTSLEENKKKFRNHSTRKTTISKLKKETLNAQTSSESQDTEALSPPTTAMKPRSRATTNAVISKSLERTSDKSALSKFHLIGLIFCLPFFLIATKSQSLKSFLVLLYTKLHSKSCR